ncbi:MAG: GyrI-like domain-containing protein [Bacteroidales bacterium]|nr:GyrI-like domain-containing protein [Bacteroidales bacterium]
MEIKQVSQSKVFGKEIKTTLETIGEHVQVLPEQILKELNQKGFSTEGPQVWIYTGADGKPETEFDLLVGFPVANDKMDVDITALEDFKCVTTIHRGTWAKFQESYCSIIGELMQNGLQMTGECREVYHNVDFENMDNNVTEIQIGIK